MIANSIILYIAVKYKIVLKNFANFAITQICSASLIFCTATTIKVVDDLFPFVNEINNRNDLCKCLPILMAYYFGYQVRDSTAIFIQLNKLIALKWPIFFRRSRLMGKILPTTILTVLYALGTIGLLLSYYDKMSIPNICESPTIFGTTRIIIVNSLGIIVSLVTICIKIICFILSKKLQGSNKRIKIVPTITINSAPHTSKIVRSKTFTDTVAKAMFFDFLNYIFLWTLPQLIYLFLYIFDAPSNIIILSNDIQTHCLFLNSILNAIIFVLTISEWRKLFIHELIKSKIFNVCLKH
ncbi:GPCR, rhodopsin-like, 7TM domain and 7TM GPCR, olfactory receptor/chemoreceptor Srsx family-containing protein [Strongyloides ratti]|uniref:GPCR, rhodopsin-like, 7TM domain and 7TM GPCR, olfactory receptor/chemoreceptor Srsx family-containing protein n=1 Tax=Strongyloides ratti TaxID=34506 RepID=A0A090N007_STRRB|nr:GPCR, rhodopsin-like, 7TM domain and 7TM GPCR, olfactory receptor/chemoreceptor Srsx family-containing protein [Strongyloides ratti]CEF69855.1 GPCR, rhodopsin-like, 7TM domain and 7TM GPCR, olfactory receptor/chemoreceptor Srsx family-containing protein [Strongyloides ratti]